TGVPERFFPQTRPDPDGRRQLARNRIYRYALRVKMIEQMHPQLIPTIKKRDESLKPSSRSFFFLFPFFFFSKENSRKKKMLKENLIEKMLISGESDYKCSLSFLASSSSTVSRYISSGTQQSTGHTAAH